MSLPVRLQGGESSCDPATQQPLFTPLQTPVSHPRSIVLQQWRPRPIPLGKSRTSIIVHGGRTFMRMTARRPLDR